MPNDGIKEEHESFGMLQFSRVSGGERALFGSSIKHSNTIVMRVSPAAKERGLNQDWYYSHRLPYVEVEMSQTQFAEAISSMNMGSGVPVTVRHANGRDMEKCPEENKRLEFEKEFDDHMKKINSKLKKLTENAKEILSASKAPTKTDKESILNQIKMLEQEIGSNTPFIYSQFNEQMDKTVLEAKGEVEAFVQNKVNSLGIEGLKSEMLMLKSKQE